jgi:hypothetical protein
VQYHMVILHSLHITWTPLPLPDSGAFDHFRTHVTVCSSQFCMLQQRTLAMARLPKNNLIGMLQYCLQYADSVPDMLPLMWCGLDVQHHCTHWVTGPKRNKDCHSDINTNSVIRHARPLYHMCTLSQRPVQPTTPLPSHPCTR